MVMIFTSTIKPAVSKTVQKIDHVENTVKGDQGKGYFRSVTLAVRSNNIRQLNIVLKLFVATSKWTFGFGVDTTQDWPTSNFELRPRADQGIDYSDCSDDNTNTNRQVDPFFSHSFFVQRISIVYIFLYILRHLRKVKDSNIGECER